MLEKIDIQVPEGQFYGLVGMNGSGKSTMIKAILDLISIDDGLITLFGKSHRNVRSREQVAYLPDRFSPPVHLRSKDFIQYAIFADVNDEVALTMGKRLESTLAGIRTVIHRIAIVFQAIIIAVVHLVTGYHPEGIQTDLALWGVRVHGALIPAILCFIAFLILIIWYDLKDEKKEELFTALQKKGLK